jgi:hypothetical protein
LNNEPEKKISDEALEFYSEIGRCISIWAVVEGYLLNVLKACAPEANIKIIGATFYAVENFRSKLGMVDAPLNIALTPDY